MAKYILKRLTTTLIVLFGVSLLLFMMLSVVPGSPIVTMMGEKVKPDVIERLTESMHLNDPWYIRYFWYVADALHGDFGPSYKLNRTVASLIGNAFPNTVILAVCAALFSWLVGIPVGIISAVKKNTLADRLFMGFALCGVSIPAFAVGMILQNLFNGILPISGFSTPGHWILPSVVLGWSASGSIARLTRSSLLEVLDSDYIRTAKAKGLKVIGLTGKTGGKLAKIADVSIIVPEQETYKIQELHLPIYHALCLMLEDRFYAE